ncbi:hypothetical protein [Succinivibrio dextrinosolvens]|uniref:hypothetical protein n=1 Tax=Succinivibrio dextrinosolvens TaxID=83771 RepID=UPI0004E15854|nr:hypothetical protein [Succinivibrio dextrinosolvens]
MSDLIQNKDVSPISASHFYRRFIKDLENNDWLITRLGVCLILGISEHKFHSVIRKMIGFPCPVKKVGKRIYYSMRAIVAFRNNLDKQGSKQ